MSPLKATQVAFTYSRLVGHILNSQRNRDPIQVMPWYGRRRTELENRSLIREQAFGESLNADKLEVLARYEVHLDRKLERMLTMLTMLVRMKELRKGLSQE